MATQEAPVKGKGTDQMGHRLPGRLTLVVAPAYLEEAATPGGGTLRKDHVNRVLNGCARLEGPGRGRGIEGDVRGATPVAHHGAKREGDTDPSKVAKAPRVRAKDGGRGRGEGEGEARDNAHGQTVCGVGACGANACVHEASRGSERTIRCRELGPRLLPGADVPVLFEPCRVARARVQDSETVIECLS